MVQQSVFLYSCAAQLHAASFRRGGRAVECTGHENRHRFVAYPGFESLPLRQINNPPSGGFFICLKRWSDSEPCAKRLGSITGHDCRDAGGRAPRVGARGDAGAVAEDSPGRHRRKARVNPTAVRRVKPLRCVGYLLRCGCRDFYLSLNSGS